jgi:hypothetical protein
MIMRTVVSAAAAVLLRAGTAHGSKSPPVDCAGSWGSYGSCSATCGDGTQSRTYTITTAAAHGGSSCPHSSGHKESRACNEQRCPPDLYDADPLDFSDNDEGSAGRTATIVIMIILVVAGVVRRIRATSSCSKWVQATAKAARIAVGCHSLDDLPLGHPFYTPA